MSADRYEITDAGDYIKATIEGFALRIDDSLPVAVIRQQARDLDWMRAEIDNADSIARHLVRQPEGIKARAAMIAQAEEIQRLRGSLGVTEAARDIALAENERLRTDLAAAVTRAEQAEARLARNTCEYCDGTGDVHTPTGEWRGECDCVYAQNNKLRARLAAIDAAPAVAVVCGTPDGFTKWILWLPYAKDATPIDVDLIARPAKDSKSTFEETARSIGIRFNDIENHENQT